MIAGPSGVGKGTVVDRLLELCPDLWYSVSATTRAARPSERDGVDYFFMTHAEFGELRDAGGFLEWFEVYGDLKGTPRGPVEERRARGDDVLLEVDVQGALEVRRSVPGTVAIFLVPPSREEQVRRLEERGAREGESADAIEARIAKADWEESQAAAFDHVVVNDDVDRAAAEIAGILKGRRSRHT